MANQSLALFLQACGAGPLRLCVEVPTGHDALRQEFEQPFLLVGRETTADLPLDHPAVSRRHAYLQVIAGRVFCLDLQSRTGIHWDGQPRRFGWLEPEGAIGIGPFAVRLLGVGRAASTATPADDWDPLAALPPGQDHLPPVSLEILSGSRQGASWRMDRVLTVMGQGPQGTLQVGSHKVTRPQCALLRTPLGLWVIDLLAPEGTSVNRTRIRYARLEDGDELVVAGLALGVRCQPSLVYTPAPRSTAIVAASNTLAPGVPAAVAEQERLNPEHRAAVAQAEQLRSQLSALEQSLAEATAARDELFKAGQEASARWEAERLALREQLEQEHRARTEEQERFDATRRQWQQQQEALHEQFDEERRGLRGEAERLRHEAAALRQDGERLASELARAVAEADPLRDRLSAVEQLLDEASVARVDLVKAGQESAARWEAERLTQWEQWQQSQQEQEQARVEDQERFDAARRQWQEQMEALHAQFDQEQRGLRDEAERLRHEAAALRQDNERLASELARAAVSSEAIEQLQALRTELEARHRQEAVLRQDLDAAHAEAADVRRQWQEQLDAVHRQFDQERRALRKEIEILRPAVEVLRHEREALLRQVSALTIAANPAGPARVPTVVRKDEPGGLDAFFIALSKGAPAPPANGNRNGNQEPPPAGP